MSLQKITLLTGTALSLLVSVGVVHPAMANPESELAQAGMNTTANVETITGIVKSIVGEVVTVDVEGGTYRTLLIERRVLGTMGLVPGSRVRASVARGGSVVQSIVVIPNVKVTASTATRMTTTTRTQTQTQTTPAPMPMRPAAPMRPPAPPARPQAAPARQAPMAPAPMMQPAAPVRGLW
ncbi:MULTISPECIES: hypothetical protein [Kamptonema]|uniref:hypothetical protein n=1 Tax=Kamptonema TaxID=1501433 RepID=UPI0001DAC798|nr:MULTISPECIES: hypothetical protein [Kamptonema]CBN53807.1 exported hypothetical protein [Kamptonema sp. PCC 6506]